MQRNLKIKEAYSVIRNQRQMTFLHSDSQSVSLISQSGKKQDSQSDPMDCRDHK